MRAPVSRCRAAASSRQPVSRRSRARLRAAGAVRRRRARTMPVDHGVREKAMAMRAGLLIAIAAAASISSGTGAAASGGSVCEGEITRAAATYGVPVGVLYAVGLTETGRRGSMQPYAMNIHGTAYFAPDARAAVRRFHEARREGMKLIDLGCMQINHHYHSDRFPSLESMLDPRRNVEYAARFLKELKDREGTW